MTQATHDCTACPVSAGTHKPADAVHTEIAEPAPQAALAVELEAAQDMLTTARTELELLREALCVPYEPHQSLFDRMLEAAKAAGVPAAAPDARDAARWAIVAHHWTQADFKHDRAGNLAKIQLSIDLTKKGLGIECIAREFDAAIAAQAGKEATQ